MIWESPGASCAWVDRLIMRRKKVEVYNKNLVLTKVGWVAVKVIIY
jgi:hypothetical protein